MEIILYTVYVFYCMAGIQRACSVGCFNFFREKENIQLIPDSEIDLTLLEGIKLDKYILIIYCRILDKRFFNKQRPSFNSLKELENFSETTPDQLTPLKKKFKQLISVGAKVLREYVQNISTHDDYLAQAFLHRWLTELKTKLIDRGWPGFEIYDEKEDAELQDTINEIIQQKKAQNYLDEILPEGNHRRGALTPFKNCKRNDMIDTWNIYGVENDKVALALKQIGNLNGGDVSSIRLLCTKMELYERIIQYADDQLFHKTFGLGQWDMMHMVDIVFNRNQIEEKLFVPAVPVNDIDLSTMTEENRQIQYYKHATILFVEAFAMNFLHTDTPLDAEIRQQLDTYPIRYEPYASTRYCTFQWIIRKIPHNLYDKLKNNDGLKTLWKRVYLRFLLNWYKFVLAKERTDCMDTIEIINNILDISNIHIPKHHQINMEHVRINRLDDLIQLGKAAEAMLATRNRGVDHSQITPSVHISVFDQKAHELESSNYTTNLQSDASGTSWIAVGINSVMEPIKSLFRKASSLSTFVLFGNQRSPEEETKNSKII